MKKAIEKMVARFADIETQLANAEAFANPSRYKELAQEHSYLSEVVRLWEQLNAMQKQRADNAQLLTAERDAELASMIAEDSAALEGKIAAATHELELLLVPPDPNDNRNAILELRAGTGGEEASLFVADCARMYRMYGDRMGWKSELLSCTPSDLGGFKDYTMVVSGRGAYRFLQYEGGTHRVQRVPETEAQGRVHTSAITVAVLFEPEEAAEVAIDEASELRIDTFRSSGAGGQHVNTTDSAVRLTHLPTGIVVSCQDERSQHKNKAKAMRLLKAKIAENLRQKQHETISSHRSQQVGSGDRSERIRTYNFPQNRLTDHRINFTKYNLDLVMQGDLSDLSAALLSHFRSVALNS